MGRRVLVAVAISCVLGCAAGVGETADGLGFGSNPAVGSSATSDEDEDDGADEDEDDGSDSGSEGEAGSTSGAGGFDTGDDTSAGGVPPDSTSGEPPATSGPPPGTSGPPDPGESSGVPEIETTGPPLGDTGGAGIGQLGDPCLQNADCQSFICVNAGFAMFCSEQCIAAADCPPGWLCVETTTPGLSVCF